MVQPIRSVALLLSSCGLRLDCFFTLALRRDFLSVLLDRCGPRHYFSRSGTYVWPSTLVTEYVISICDRAVAGTNDK